jgi:hypothetical protein
MVFFCLTEDDMDRFATALKARGFKTLDPRGSEFRANRLFKRPDHDTITIEVDLRKACRVTDVYHLPRATVDVFSTHHFKRRGRRNYDTTYFIRGGNRSSLDDRDFSWNTRPSAWPNRTVSSR